METRGQVDGALDATVALYVSFVRQSLGWWRRAYGPQINVDMDPCKIARGQSEPLMWEEARLIVLWCLGYIWENGGFAKHWVERGGGWRLEWKRRDPEKHAKHVAQFAPVIRFILVYMLTGTRLSCALQLGWTEDFYRGWIHLDGVLSKIYRTGTKGPNYRNKPRETSLLLPLARRMFEDLRANDMRKAARDGWVVPEGGYYVVHNGHGGPVTNIKYLVRLACAAVGVQSSSHKLKNAGVTTFWLAGFDLDRIAVTIGNDIKTTHDHYLYLERLYAGVFRPRPEPEKMLFGDLVDPRRDIKPIPRGGPPACPAETHFRADEAREDA
jgi:hypothetical protein